MYHDCKLTGIALRCKVCQARITELEEQCRTHRKQVETICAERDDLKLQMIKMAREIRAAQRAEDCAKRDRDRVHHQWSGAPEILKRAQLRIAELEGE